LIADGVEACGFDEEGSLGTPHGVDALQEIVGFTRSSTCTDLEGACSRAELHRHKGDPLISVQQLSVQGGD